MTIEDLAKAQELTLALQEGIETQQEVLTGLKTSLEAYREFLINSVKDLQEV